MFATKPPMFKLFAGGSTATKISTGIGTWNNQLGAGWGDPVHMCGLGASPG